MKRKNKRINISHFADSQDEKTSLFQNSVCFIEYYCSVSSCCTYINIAYTFYYITRRVFFFLLIKIRSFRWTREISRRNIILSQRPGTLLRSFIVIAQQMVYLDGYIMCNTRCVSVSSDLSFNPVAFDLGIGIPPKRFHE